VTVLELPVDRLRAGRMSDAEAVKLSAEILEAQARMLRSPQEPLVRALADRLRRCQLEAPTSIRSWP
jgi:hypothetical protein